MNKLSLRYSASLRTNDRHIFQPSLRLLGRTQASKAQILSRMQTGSFKMMKIRIPQSSDNIVSNYACSANNDSIRRAAIIKL